jgi:hypothetical protein
MISWMAVITVVGTLNGQPYVREHRVMDLPHPESCLRVARAIRARLPTGLRIGPARCDRVWWA